MEDSEEILSFSNFFRGFLLQFFGISSSAGTLVGTAIGLFRTFQRVGSTKAFTVHFSKQCYQMFDWALHLIEIISSSLYIRPFPDVFDFYFYTFLLPLTLLIFISTLIYTYKILNQLLLVLLLTIFGIGFGLIGINSILSLIFISVPILIILVCIKFRHKILKFIGYYNFTDDDIDIDIHKDGKTSILLSTFAAFFVFSFISFPFTFTSTKFVFVSINLFAGIFIIFLFIEPFNIGIQLIGVIFSIVSLLFIPTAECFVNIMKGDYKNDWAFILGYIGDGIFLPIVLTLSTILFDESSLRNKYRDFITFYDINILYYIELLDVFKQIAFSFVAAYNISWGCIGIEVIWILFILILHPYICISDYALQIGSSIVVFIGNAFAIAHKNDGTIFSFHLSLIIVILACIPAILSAFLFFILDFNPIPRKKDIIYELSIKNWRKGALLSPFIPIAFFFYALCVPKFIKLTFN